MKLNLGSGGKHIYGFVNVDGRADTKPDVVCDLKDIASKFHSIDLIYASHVLEHFPFAKNSYYPTTCYDLLLNWHTALKSGGILRLAVPDFEAATKYLPDGAA